MKRQPQQIKFITVNKKAVKKTLGVHLGWQLLGISFDILRMKVIACIFEVFKTTK